MFVFFVFFFFFFFNDTATTEIYTLSLHDALRSRHLSVAGGAGEGCHPMGTFSYRRQSDLRARRFPAVGSIGDLAAITSYRIAGNRSTRSCRGGHGAAASDEGRQSRWRPQRSGE